MYKNRPLLSNQMTMSTPAHDTLKNRLAKVYAAWKTDQAKKPKKPRKAKTKSKGRHKLTLKQRAQNYYKKRQPEYKKMLKRTRRIPKQGAACTGKYMKAKRQSWKVTALGRQVCKLNPKHAANRGASKKKTTKTIREADVKKVQRMHQQNLAQAVQRRHDVEFMKKQHVALQARCAKAGRNCDSSLRGLVALVGRKVKTLTKKWKKAVYKALRSEKRMKKLMKQYQQRKRKQSAKKKKKK
jgi:hypothetical protein